MNNLSRLAEPFILELIKSFPAVYLAGPRQSGKTTLTQHIAQTAHPATYLSFDDIQLRGSAQESPQAFLEKLKGPVILDEIQTAPELFRPLKIVIDQNRNASDGGRGKFLLTGSASVLALPQLSDALVGRMALHTLLPFSACEVYQQQHSFIDRAFNNDWHIKQITETIPVTTAMHQASFPEASQLNTPSLRQQWCNGYINTILQRDVHTLLEVEKITRLPDMLRLLAARTGSLLNETNLARETELNQITSKRYRILLESLFLTFSVPAWSKNFGKRLIKSPKVYLSDLNLLAYLLNIELESLPHTNSNLFGRVLENFVAMELTKQLTFSHTQAQLYHYRSSSGQEIDFLLQGPAGKVVAIEVKSKSQVNNKDFRHLEVIREEIGNNFHCGYVLYQGKTITPFGKDMWALPISTLWE